MVVAIQRRPKTVGVDTRSARELETTLKESAPISDHEISIWRADAYIASENDRGIRRLLRRSSLQFLLSQVHDGESFAFKGLQTNKVFGQSEFHLIMHWLRVNGLANKHGRQYTIPSIESVKRRWNEVISEETVI